MSRGSYGFGANFRPRGVQTPKSAPVTEATLFKALLAETDALLSRAWYDGRLPAGIIPDDLVQRTRAALTGETSMKQMTNAEAVAAAFDRLKAESERAA